jgi:alkanesulfonate monooxygenase SsuD/methylene tetrahydromethanopterin reductase-like flavin-dependent oxidoreductase (luciferase family)
MRLGLFAAAQYPAGTSPAAFLEHHIDQVVVARDAGFSTLLSGQHFLSHPYQEAQPIPFLGRLSSVVGEIRIGPGILL